MNEDFKNLKEIIELCRLEIDEGDKNINATLDYEDLKELFYLLEFYQQEKEKNKQLEEVIDLMAKDMSNSDIDEYICKQCACFESDNAEECRECIKQYYFKKAGDRP